MTGTLHIVVAMKPVEGNFAENAVKNGVAGLWVDGVRVSTSDALQGGAGGLLSNVRDGKAYPADNGYKPSSLGRFPANVVLGHMEDCKWECVEGCPVKTIDEQSGKTKGVIRHPTGRAIYPTDGQAMKWNSNDVRDTTVRGYNDVGGASRYFKQVSELEE